MTDNGKLQVTMPTDREIVMTWVFNAPRNLVFDAWTKPDLIKLWLLVWMDGLLRSARLTCRLVAPIAMFGEAPTEL